MSDALPAVIVGISVHGSVRESGGEVAVVENPDLHVQLPGLVQNDVEIMPPAGSRKIRMRPGLEADRPDPGFMDHMHIVPECLLRLSVLPEKGKKIVAALPPQKFYKFSAHLIPRFLSFPRDHRV